MAHMQSTKTIFTGGVAARTRQFIPFVQGARSWFTYDEKFLRYAKIASFCCI